MRLPVAICPCNNSAAGGTIDAIRQFIESPSSAVLSALEIDAETYQVLMPSAIASLTGVHRSNQQGPREDFVRRMLTAMTSKDLIASFVDNTRSGGRYDFSVKTNSSRTVAIDVKGGEGNSITIASRPLHCNEYGIWCHFTGSLAKHPGVQARAVISRMLKVMLNREEDSKRYDFLIVWDTLCGSSARLCPLARGSVIPCVILFPQVQATKSSPHPILHDLSTTEFPNLLYSHLGLSSIERMEHVWQCDIELFSKGTDWYRRVKFIRLKDGTVQELSPTKCNPEDTPKATP